jgi:uncharacterized membrane protein YkoI
MLPVVAVALCPHGAGSLPHGFRGSSQEGRMRTFLGSLTAVVGLALLVLAGGVRAAEEKTPLDKVPAKVLAAAKAKYPKAEIVSAEKEDENGKIVYEFKLTEGDKKWEATFTAGAKFVGIEEVIKESDLPAKVKEALRKKYPDAKIARVEKETTGEGEAAKVIYEILITTAKGKREVEFAPTGKIVAEEEKK